MTQELNRQPSSSHRRSNRSAKKRPVLVTSTANETREPAVNPTLVESLAEVEQQNAAVEPSRARRLPSFFSIVGKKAQTEPAQEADIAQARLARATRGKAAANEVDKPASDANSEEKSATRRVTPKASTPARPASAFKTRYLLGMGLYLLGANFIGTFETSLMNAYHLNQELTRFSLFGGPVIVNTSTVVFLATLVLLLVLLARLDLIPRNLGALSGQASTATRRGTSNSQNSSEGVKSAPPTMRQGVKGADDDLYEEYRTNQRRNRKK